MKARDGVHISMQNRLSITICAVLGLLCGTAAGQSTPQGSTPAPYTLHVYEDLVQMPTLVLHPDGAVVAGLTRDQFNLRLDSGPPFHPRHVRLEGDDSLSVALLLQVSTPGTAAIARLLGGNITLGPDWLSPTDRITVYGVDCTLVQAVNQASYSPTLLASDVRAVFAAHDLHNGRPNPHCGGELKLWDVLATIVKRLANTPGRHVIFAVTDGEDHNSRLSWNDLHLYAGRYSVTIIGLRPSSGWVRERDNMGWTGAAPSANDLFYPEEIFGILCGETGGLVLPVQPATIDYQLGRAVALLRSRYILEFARPSNGTGGLHDIDARVDQPAAVIRMTGLAFPIRDKRLLADPNTLPSDPSRAPQEGTRKVLSQPH